MNHKELLEASTIVGASSENLEYIEENFIALPDKEVAKDHWRYEEEEFWRKVLTLEQDAIGELDSAVTLKWLTEFDKEGRIKKTVCENYALYKLFQTIPNFEFLRDECKDRFETIMENLVDTWNRKQEEMGNIKSNLPSGIFIR